MKEKTRNILALKCVPYIYLASSLLLTTGFSGNRAMAADTLVAENQNIELSSSSTPQESEVALKDLAQNVDIKQEAVVPEKQPQVVAQAASPDIEQLRQQFLIEPIITPGQPSGANASPGSSAGTPTAYGASGGQAYIGVGGYIPLNNDKNPNVDGSLSVGFGVGDAVKSVGLETSINIISVGGNNDHFDFAESGGVGFKLHKYFQNGTAVAVGWSNPIKWGEANKAKDTIYGVVTKSFDLNPSDEENKLPLTVSVGVGNGSFRSLGAIKAGDNTPNVFGSLGLRVAPQASLVSSWTGNSLNLGTSFVPFQEKPLVLNAIVTDVFTNLGGGAGLSLSAGYSFKF
jgi:hypothetical protein